jgi:uncharacterized protein YigA (DUF484 family)
VKRSLVIALGLSALVACAPTARFARYTDSSFSSTTDVEVLRTKPADRPYIELGEIRLQLKKSNEDDAILVLKEKAKEVGADAMVILGEQSRGTAILPMGGMAVAVPLRDLVAVAIRYKR